MLNLLFNTARPGATGVSFLSYSRALVRKSQYFLAGILLWGGITNCAWAILVSSTGSVPIIFHQKTGDSENMKSSSVVRVTWNYRPGEAPPSKNGVIEEFYASPLVVPDGIRVALAITFDIKFMRFNASSLEPEHTVTCTQSLSANTIAGKLEWYYRPLNACTSTVLPLYTYTAEITASSAIDVHNTTDKPFSFYLDPQLTMYQGAFIAIPMNVSVEGGRSCTIDIADSLYLGKIAASTLQKKNEGEIIDELGGALGATLKCNSSKGGKLTITSSSTSADGCASDNIGSLNYCAFIDGKKVNMGDPAILIYGALAEKNITFLTTKGKNITGGRSEAKILLTFEPR